jgi:glutathione S-transferase
MAASCSIRGSSWNIWTISPVARLLPQENRRLINTRRWEALADGITDAAVAIVLEQRRPADKQMPDWIARQQDKIDRGLAAMSSDLGERQWCNGEGYSLADIAVGCCLAIWISAFLPLTGASLSQSGQSAGTVVCPAILYRYPATGS